MIKKLNFLKILLLVYGLWSMVYGLSGCGYTTKGFFYPENKIRIVPVVNKMGITSEEREYSGYRTFPILLEKKLTNELVKKFNTYGHLKVVSREEGALKLSCSIGDYEKEALRYDSSEDVREQRLRLHVHMTLISSSGELLQDKGIVGETEYFLSGAGSKSEESAREDLIDDTARRIFEAVTEAW